MHRYELVGIKPYVAAPPLPHAGLASQELKTCTDKVVLSLEDDRSVTGPRAAFKLIS